MLFLTIDPHANDVSKQKVLNRTVLDKVHLDARVHVDATESSTTTHGDDGLRDALGRSGVKVGRRSARPGRSFTTVRTLFSSTMETKFRQLPPIAVY
jgi:hypothetical protein